MALDVLENIKSESLSLYNEIIRVAKKKWDVIDFEKRSSEFYIITVRNNKKPEEIFKVKCVFQKYRWYLVGEQ